MNNLNIVSWKKVFQSLWYFLDGERLKFSFYMLLNFLSHTNNLLIPFIVGLIINFFTEYTKGEDLTLFYIYTGIILISSLVSSQVRVVSKRKLSEIAVLTKFNVRTQSFDRLLNFSLKWHEKENTGNKTQKINSGADSYSALIKLFYQGGLAIILSFIGIITIFTFLDISFLIFFIVYILGYILIVKYYMNKQAQAEEDRNKYNEKISGSLIEGTNNILVIKSSGSTESLQASMKGKEKKLKEKQFKVIKVGYSKTRTINILTSLGLFFFLLLVGYYVSNDLIAVGFIATAFAYFTKITENFWKSNSVINDLISIRSSINRIIPIFETKEDKFFGEKQLNSNWKEISFNEVSFSYNNDSKNLDNISFNIKKNESVGIVGHSGSGKSTLSKLLLGLYKINLGEIKIDNNSFYEFEHQNLLESISQVMQETEMFNMSLKENITMLKEVNSKTLQEAIKIAQLEELIDKLPEGLNTIIGEKGYKLSGGERQRVGIARAICKNSNILILDEATSALDSKTELKIQEGINSLENKTILIIAHRLSTLKNVDKILVFDKGKLVEKGNFKELINDSNSKFHKIWNMQK